MQHSATELTTQYAIVNLRGRYMLQLQHTATHCNTLQHTAAHCSTLQHAATRCNTLHCNTLQHTATHCNTLQHTTTRLKTETFLTWIFSCVTCNPSKQLKFFSKQPWIFSKQPWIFSKQPCILYTDPLKMRMFSMKCPKFWKESSVFSFSKRALHCLKRAPYLSPNILHCLNELYVFSKESTFSRKSPKFPQKSLVPRLLCTCVHFQDVYMCAYLHIHVSCVWDISTIWIVRVRQRKSATTSGICVYTCIHTYTTYIYIYTQVNWSCTYVQVNVSTCLYVLLVFETFLSRKFRANIYRRVKECWRYRHYAQCLRADFWELSIAQFTCIQL